jgi:hypothetical protein
MRSSRRAVGRGSSAVSVMVSGASGRCSHLFCVSILGGAYRSAPRVRVIVRRAYGFHSADAALALVMLGAGPITLRLPHERAALQAAARPNIPSGEPERRRKLAAHAREVFQGARSRVVGFPLGCRTLRDLQCRP